MQKNALGIIPARGGSKGILRKNIRLVGGRPLIAYAIDAARQSQSLANFVVSTDDLEIADIAKREGASILMRPSELAEDNTPMMPVLDHVLKTIQESYKYVILLQPTAPLRTARDIDKAVNILNDSGADSVISVYQVEDHHPSRMYTIVEEKLIPYTEEPINRLRQSLPKVYHRNGAIYACKASLITDQGTLIGSDVRPYIMPRSRSINIDDEFDLVFADFLISNNQEILRDYR